MNYIFNNIKLTIKEDLKDTTFRIMGVIIVIVGIIIVVPGLNVIDPIKELFGLPCPGCGMTRATYALMDFDFVKAWEYNPSIYFLALAFILLPLRNLKVFKNKLTSQRIFSYFVIALVLVFIIRVIFFWGEGVIHISDDSLFF